MFDANLPMKPDRGDGLNHEKPDLERLARRLKRFEPRAPRLSDLPALLLQAKSQIPINDLNTVSIAPIRSYSLGAIAGAWACGGAVGAAIMFVVFHFSPRELAVDSLGTASISPLHPRTAVDRIEPAVAALNSRQPGSEEVTQPVAMANPDRLRASQSPLTDHLLDGGLFAPRALRDRTDLRAGLCLSARGKWVSTSAGNESSEPRFIGERDFESRVHQSEISSTEPVEDPAQPATRHRLLRELLDESRDTLL